MNISQELIKEISADLTENHFASEMSYMMMENSKERAHEIRVLSDSKKNNSAETIREFQVQQKSIESAVNALLKGHKGFSLRLESENNEG